MKHKDVADGKQLRNLFALSLVFDHLHQHGAVPDTELSCLIEERLEQSRKLKAPIELTRGRAMIPLPGIDVPFHSSYLRPGVDSYRKFLQSRMMASNALPAKLINKFIPNVMARPFSLDRIYIKEAYDLTGSHVLRDLLV